MNRETLIRRWQDSDDVSAVTGVLHRAYAGLASLGFRYHASWQDDATTLQRLRRGVAWIALREARIVGTATLYVPPNVRGCDWYDRGDVAYFGQFAVEPDLQGEGIGRQLLEAIEAETRRRGIPHLALDTAAGATRLIETYRRHGFVQVGTADWSITNYQSIVMNKPME